MEGKVYKLAKKMEELYTRRCSSEMAKCEKKSFNSCVGIGDKFCNFDYPKQSADCLIDGSYVSESSAIKFPGYLDFNNLPNLHRSMVCTSAHL